MRSDSVFSTSSLQAYLSLTLLCGVALAMSIQPPSRIAVLRASDLSYPPGLFHLAFVFLLGLFAVNRGSVIAANKPGQIPQPKLVPKFLAHIAYGLVLLLPYLVYSRALLPTRIPGIALLVLYATVSCLFFCLASFRLEVRGTRRKRGAFLLRYGLYAAFCAVPFGVGMSHHSLSLAVSASPVGFATRIIEGAMPGELFVGFLIPSVGILWLLTRRRRFTRRHHAV